MIYLKKDYVSKSGNFYSRGKYNSIEELPEVIRKNPDYISARESTSVVISNEPIRHVGNTKEIPAIRPVVSRVVEEPKLNINTASVEEISSLQGVGKATAKKITELREEAPFSSREDLNTRVPLPGSRDWKQYSILFES
jgi:hypothetical protein